MDYTHAISNGLWSATTTLVVGGITNEIKNEIYRDEVNEDIVEEIDKKISCSVY